jgi:hypothetical protein
LSSQQLFLIGKNKKYRLLTVSLVVINSVLLHGGVAEAILDNTLQVVDLSDMVGELPLQADSTTQVLWQTQDWEHSSLGNAGWPSGGVDSVGYPSMVKNTHGQNPDGKYYLYYAHHDPTSGIGCAVADAVTGPYIKASISHEVLGTVWADSQVLVNPLYRPLGIPVDWIGHYSSPSVVWNEDEQLWFMYFHYYNHFWGGAGGEAWSVNNPGLGHQMTALATCPDLSSHNWTLWTDSAWAQVSVDDTVPVLPTTDALWMESQSSYHAVQRLPDGQWLAFMRGTPVTGGPTVGFGTSSDGRNWNYFAENPVIAPGKSWTVSTSEYRPKFVGYLGEGDYLVAWAEHSHPQIIYSTTTDFKTFTRDPRGCGNWGTGDDGLVSAWREGNELYLFSGKNIHRMALNVSDSNNYITGAGLHCYLDFTVDPGGTTVIDQTGNGNNGELINGPDPDGAGPVTGVPHWDGTGIRFFGGWIDVDPTGSLNTLGSGTLEVIIDNMPITDTVISTGAPLSVANTGNTGRDNDFEIWLDHRVLANRSAHFNGRVGGVDQIDVTYLHGMDIPDGGHREQYFVQWNGGTGQARLVGRHQAGGVLTVNSTPWEPTGSMPDFLSAAINLRLGARNNGNSPMEGPHFNSQVNILRVYDRILTDAEMQQNWDVYNGPIPSGPATCQEAIAGGFGLAGDLDGDCYVTLSDLAVQAGDWLVCVDPANLNCERPWLE